MKTVRKRMLSVAESASYVGKSTKTIRRYIKQGILSCERINGNYGPEIRIPRKSLDSLLKNMSNPSRPEDESLELLLLYRKASPEIRGLVKKILKSSPDEEVKVEGGGFFLPFFRKRGGEKD